MRKRVVFLCTGNSARSQMAEVLLPLIAGEHFEAVSAGTHPVGLNPMTIEIMKELGVDMTGQRSKSVQEFVGQQFDYVITVCDRAKETCPIFPSVARILHWSFEDPAAAPAAERVEIFRRVRRPNLSVHIGRESAAFWRAELLPVRPMRCAVFVH